MFDLRPDVATNDANAPKTNTLFGFTLTGDKLVDDIDEKYLAKNEKVNTTIRLSQRIVI